MDSQIAPYTSESLVVPEGYMLVIGNSNQRYIVPDFMIPATHQAFEGYQRKLDLHVSTATGGSGNTHDIPYFLIGEDKVVSPHDPTLTERECLGLHAEIKSLQERLGISYKDASHHLYMAELEKLKAEKDASKAFSNLMMRTERAVKMFNQKADELAGQHGSGGSA
ncbi:hypothetical protein BYT27DRAFT_7103388 [Phlegmacium glaucopus]|nr:hypothetical protein BYT27DRAFT_7103388 [Phlegmacium glaucopus]